MEKLIDKRTAKLTRKKEVGKAPAGKDAGSDSYIKELNYRNSALQAINIIADKLYQSFDITTIAKEAVESVVRYSNSSRAVLYEFDEKNKLLKNLYSHGFSARTVKAGSILPLEGSLSGIAIKRKQVVSSFDLASNEATVPTVKKALLDDGLNVGICIPLIFQNKVFGVMNLLFSAHNRNDFEDYEKDVFLSIGKTVGLAMANARHVDQIKEETDERKKAEQALQISENKYRNIFNNTTEGLFQTTAEGRVLTVNPALARILGYDSPEEAIDALKNLRANLYVQPERRKEFLDLISKQGFVRNFEYKAYRKDRQIIDVSVNVDKIRNEDNKTIYFEGVLRDVTELKKYREHLEELVRERTSALTEKNEKLLQEIAERERVEKALRDGENKYRSIFNNTTEGIYQTSPDGKVLTCNPALAQILGYDSPDDVINNIKNLATDLYVNAERRKEFLALISKQGFIRDFEFEAYRKDRQIVNVSVSVHFVRDENDKPLYLEGVLKDITELKKYQEGMEKLVNKRTAELTRINEKLQQEITERKRAEEALRESEIKYRSIFNNITDGIFQTSAEGRVLTCNPALAEILGYDSPADVIENIKNLGKDLYVLAERRQEFLDLMSAQGFVKDFEYQAYRKDRLVIDVVISCYAVRDENNRLLYFEGVLRDITELKKYQKYLEDLVREHTA